MASSCLNLVRFLVLLYQVDFIFGFNLDARVPLLKEGIPGSYFGYSVAQHILEIRGGRDIKESRSRLLVGAPKFNDSGAVYACKFSTSRSDCEVLRIEEPEPQSTEVRKDQWLGVTIRSQGFNGYVVTCAHRHVKNETTAYWGLGICYSLNSFLDVQQALSPCEGRSYSKAHEEFGYCQAGISADIAPDNSSIFGVPGAYTWRGTISSNSAEDEMDADRQWYLGPLEPSSSPVDKYSYLGMSVTHGKFFNDTLSYVGGAPRSKGNGQVVFFKKFVSVPLLEVQLILTGDKFASSYGYEMCSIDVNNDKLVDLVVGAPFYYDKNVGGAIYIYKNSANFIEGKTVPQIIKGKPDSRFGFSLANLKDLNKDKYEDLAVGAPYENHGVVYIYLGSKDGLKHEPSQVIKSQDLPHGPIPTFGYSLAGGVDLDFNGYPDLLVGAYEADKVVLIRSRPIIAFQTDVKGTLSDIDPSKQDCVVDGQSYTCFRIETCFGMASPATPLNIEYSLIAEVFEGRKYSRVSFDSSRHTPAPYRIDRLLTVNGALNVANNCKKELVYLNDTRSKKDILNPIRFQVTYQLRYEQPKPEKEYEPLLDMNRYPILDQQQADKYFVKKFTKKCGDDDICQSDLHISASLLNLETGKMLLRKEKEVELLVSVVNRNESAYEAGLFVTYPSSLMFIGSMPAVICDRIQNQIHCTLGNPLNNKEQVDVKLRFNPTAIQDTEHDMTFIIKANSSSQEIPKPDTVVQAEISRIVELSIDGLGSEEQVFYGGEILGESAIKHEDQVGSNVTHVYQVRNGGPWKLQSLKVVVHWPYEVENRKKHGKWLLYLMENPFVQFDKYRENCEIDPARVNPLKLKAGNQTSSDAPEYPDNVQSDAPAAYTYKKSANDISKSRRKRQADNGSDKPADLRSENVYIMECNHTAKCFSFRCEIKSLEPNKTASIKIRSRLWSHTFVEDYSNVDLVVIRSHAALEFDPNVVIQQDPSDDTAIAETKAYPDIKVAQTIKEVPIWIIIVAVCAGILLLIIIILVLWKLGFFRRKKHEAMMKGDLHKQPNDVNNANH